MALAVVGFGAQSIELESEEGRFVIRCSEVRAFVTDKKEGRHFLIVGGSGWGKNRQEVHTKNVRMRVLWERGESEVTYPLWLLLEEAIDRGLPLAAVFINDPK